MVTNSHNKKSTYLPVITFFTGFLCAFLIFWNPPSEQKGRSVEIKSNEPDKPFVMKSNKPFYQPQKLPERTSSQGGVLFSQRLERDTPPVKKDIRGPVQGKVTMIDWCSNTFFIDDVPFNIGDFDLTGIEMGNRVEVTYTDTKQGKVIESIKLIH
jgi:hypothetical protein